MPKEELWVFLPFCFSLHWLCLFPQLTWVKIASLLSCPGRKAASRWAELRPLSPPWGCLGINLQWRLGGSSAAIARDIHENTVPVLPIPVGGGRRAVLGTRRAEWEGQWEQGLSYRVFRGGSRPSSAPQGEEAQGGQVSCIVALTILYPLFPACLRALENVTNSHSHGRDLSFTYKSSFPGHFLRPFLSSWVPSHSPMKAHTLAQLSEFPCLTHILVFSIHENFHLLRYLNFLSVYCSAFKKLFTSVLITFSP